jgi:hypothetical protein
MLRRLCIVSCIPATPARPSYLGVRTQDQILALDYENSDVITKFRRIRFAYMLLSYCNCCIFLMAYELLSDRRPKQEERL